MSGWTTGLFREITGHEPGTTRPRLAERRSQGEPPSLQPDRDGPRPRGLIGQLYALTTDAGR